jgi:hypothetical protein
MEERHVPRLTSRKFTPSRLESLLSAAGFSVTRRLEPETGCFSLLPARPD